MKWMVQLVALVTAVTLQAQTPHWFVLGNMKWPLVLSCVLYYSLADDAAMMLVAALLGGLVHDAMSDIPLGYSSGLFAFLGWGVSRFRRQLVADSSITRMVLGASLTVLHTLVIFVLLRCSGEVELGGGTLLTKLLASSLLGCLAGPMVCGILGTLEHKLGSRERSRGYA